MRVALVGSTGYWGSKLYQILTGRGCDVECFNSKNIETLWDSDVDQVYIATPPPTHYYIVSRCLGLGMDVFVEKPVAMSAEQAEALWNKAQSKGCVLFIDSTFLYTQSFEHLKEVAFNQTLISYQSLRVSPPMPQACINAAWDLVWHDMAILSGLGVLERGKGFVDGSVATCALPLPSGGSAFIYSSRVWPDKIRQIVMHFSKESYVWTLDGLHKVNGEIILQEDMQPLWRAIEESSFLCKNRIMEGATNGSHGVEVAHAIEQTFQEEFYDCRYAEEYQSCTASAAGSLPL